MPGGETNRKGKGKGNGGKSEHEGKGGGFGSKGFQQSVRQMKRMSGSEWRQTWRWFTPQATSDPRERERDIRKERNPRDEMGSGRKEEEEGLRRSKQEKR